VNKNCLDLCSISIYPPQACNVKRSIYVACTTRYTPKSELCNYESDLRIVQPESATLEISVKIRVQILVVVLVILLKASWEYKLSTVEITARISKKQSVLDEKGISHLTTFTPDTTAQISI